MSDQAATSGDNGGDAGQGAEAQGPDMAALAERLDGQGATLEELRGFLQSNPWQQPEPEQADDGPDLGFLDELSPGVDTDELASNLSQLIEHQSREQMAPLQAQLAQQQQMIQEAQRERQADDLVAEFPELGDPKVAQEVVGLSAQMAEQMGQPELAQNPAFWRMTYLAGRAMQQANSEGNAPRAAHLEGAGGAGPGGGEQVDLGDMIVNAKQGRGALPF